MDFILCLNINSETLLHLDLYIYVQIFADKMNWSYSHCMTKPLAHDAPHALHFLSVHYIKLLRRNIEEVLIKNHNDLNMSFEDYFCLSYLDLQNLLIRHNEKIFQFLYSRRVLTVFKFSAKIIWFNFNSFLAISTKLKLRQIWKNITSGYSFSELVEIQI